MPTVPVTAAGWRIEPPVSLPRATGASKAATAAAEPPPGPAGGRGGGAAPGAARDPVERPRVAGGAVGGVLGGGAHRELVHVGLAERHHAGGLEAGRPPGGGGGVPPLEDLRAAGSGHPFGDDDVLEGDRDAGQTGAPPAGAVDLGR